MPNSALRLSASPNKTYVDRTGSKPNFYVKDLGMGLKFGIISFLTGSQKDIMPLLINASQSITWIKGGYHSKQCLCIYQTILLSDVAS